MMDFDWKKLIGSVAPMLGTALGGPLGGAAATAIAAALGLDSAEDASIASAMANATPEQLMMIKKAEADFKARMAELGFANEQALAKLAADDRNSARQREIAVRDWTPGVLAYGVTLGFFGILAFLLIRDVPSQSRDILNIMLGALGTAWVSVIAYYFGSSAGSERKTDLLAKSAPIA